MSNHIVNSSLLKGWYLGHQIAEQRLKAPPITAGLYETDTSNLIYSWEDMLADGVVSISNGVVTDNYDLSSSLAGDLVLPSDGSITEIGEYFFGYSGITKVTIPEGVKTIQGFAFESTKLTSIRIPASVTSISWDGFRWCNDLVTVSIASGNTMYYSDRNHVYSADGLTLLFVPRTVTRYSIADTVQHIAESVFYNHTITSIGIAGSECMLELPTSLRTIGKSAFSYCKSLTSVDIPNGVTSIGDSAFTNCSSLVDVSINDDLTSLGSSVFNACTSLVVINLPNTITTLGSGAFIECTSLTTVNIPNKITDLANSMFSGCTSLAEIVIPAAVVEISPYAFQNCTKLSKAVFEITSGWYAESYGGSTTDIAVTNTSTAAKLLRDTYGSYYCHLKRRA